MSELSINTSQNVLINFKAASPGSRILANILDLIIKGTYLFMIYVVLFTMLSFDKITSKWDHWSVMALSMVLFLPVAFYSLVLESLLEGQTVGKRIMKIKIVKIDGYQASFGDHIIRWLFRLVDVTMSFGVVGLVSIIIGDKRQRLGDIASGTAVISLKNDITLKSTILENIGDEYKPIYPLVIKLSDNDMRIIKEMFNKALAKDDFTTIKKLVEKVETVTGIKNQSGNTRDFIRTVMKDYNFYTQNM